MGDWRGERHPGFGVFDWQYQHNECSPDFIEHLRRGVNQRWTIFTLNFQPLLDHAAHDLGWRRLIGPRAELSGSLSHKHLNSADRFGAGPARVLKQLGHWRVVDGIEN